MAFSTTRPTLLGKRKRACEPCLLMNQQCDADNDSACHNCIQADIAFTACSGITSPASSQRTSLPRPSPTNWSQQHSRDELGNPNHQLGLVATTPSSVAPLLSPGGGRTGVENRTQWHLSPGSQNLSVSPQSNSPQNGGQDGVYTLSPENGYNGRYDNVETISAILARFNNGNFDVHNGTGTGTAPINDIPLPAAASFFRTYFTVIHPQYPFLDIKLCTEYYTTWRNSLPNATLVGWPAFFINMIFAIGSLIESKSDNSPYPQYQNLKSRAQAEQSIMADTTSTPLLRLQAMLLSAMFALHAESTWRIAHISGAIMKFAALHRFNRIKRNASDSNNLMSIRVWSCAYVLDRAVSSALGTPVSLPDMYISTPLFDATPEAECHLPWLADCASIEGDTYPDLRTFPHVCKIRSIQSFFMHMVEKDDLEDAVPLELEMHMLKSLREWESPNAIANHSEQNSHGYQSSLWLRHIGHLTRLSICLVNKSNMFTAIADTALRASYDACIGFRSLQKKKQIAQPWLVVLSQFRAAVTIWYIIWARAIPVPREASDAFRDCSAVLAIFADRWPKAENYRDCFELLAVSIPRSQPLGHLTEDIKQKLVILTRSLEESGIHRTTSRMLWEMCTDATVSPR